MHTTTLERTQRGNNTSATPLIEPDDHVSSSESSSREQTAQALLQLGACVPKTRTATATATTTTHRTAGPLFHPEVRARSLARVRSKPMHEIIVNNNNNDTTTNSNVNAISDSEDDDYSVGTQTTAASTATTTMMIMECNHSSNSNKRQHWTMEARQAMLCLPHIPVGRPLPPAPCLPQLAPGQNVLPFPKRRRLTAS